MRAALLISAKDLKARLRDRSALLLAVVVPLALAFIFNLIFGGIGNSKAVSLGVVVEDARSHLPEILASAAAAGAAIRSVEVAEPDLEAVFLHLTGRALRD